MTKVLIIANEYYPNPSAITNCFKFFIDEMKYQGFKIDILTKKQSISMLDEEVIDGVKVYRVNDWFYNSYEITNNFKKYNGTFLMNIANFISMCGFKFSRFINYFIDVKLFNNQDGFINKKEAIKLGKSLYSKNKYDIIISLSYPFVMHKIAYKIFQICDANITKWFAYQFDPHTLNATLNPKRIKKRLKEEVLILSRANKIFLPKESYRENIETELKILEDKYIVFPYVNIVKKEYNCCSNKSENIEFIFTGTIYNKIREPDGMLEFFCYLKENTDFKFVLKMYYICTPNLENIMKKYKKKLNESLILYGQKSKMECDEKIHKANIIVNIGNEISNQTPSKIFEYISTGKPIINFHTIDDDTSMMYLKDYPLALNINTNKKYNQNTLLEFTKFCQKNRNKRIDFDEINKIYLSSREVSKMFVEEIKK